MTSVGGAHSRYSYTVVLHWTGLAHWYRGELSQAEDLFSRSRNLCMERGFPLIEAANSLGIGLVSGLRGQPQAGLGQVRRDMSRTSEGDSLAIGNARAERPMRLFAILIPAIEWAEQTGVATVLAPMHHLKGQLLEDKFHLEEAKKSFRTSIEIARRQSAKSFELGVTTSFARFLAKQERRDEARAMLAEIYNWFTDGFDTAGLKHAKAQLEEMAG
jgi:hypothetical protein